MSMNLAGVPAFVSAEEGRVALSVPYIEGHGIPAEDAMALAYALNAAVMACKEQNARARDAAR